MRVSRILGLLLLAAAGGASAVAPPDDFPTLRAVLDGVGRNYVEPSRVDPGKMLWAAARALDQDVPEVRLESDPGSESLTLEVAGVRQSFPVGDVRSLRDLGRRAAEILRFVGTHRVTSSKPVAEYVAINGMLSTLDPHSLLLDPAEAKEFATNLASRFFGVGITFDISGSPPSGAPPGIPVVLNVVNGGPAEAAGIEACDRILAVEDRWATGMDWMDLAGVLRGPGGSPVWVTLLRDGAVKDVVVTRGEIKVPSVTSRRLDGDVGLIRVAWFSQGTAAEVLDAVVTLKKEGATAWILDLRTNVGGLLRQAIDTASLFVRTGPIVTTVGGGGSRREVESATRPPQGLLEEGPLVVLVGPSTASSGEVLAAALQNRNRAALLGRTSYGKGSVQVLYDEKDGSKLKLTIALYFTPGGASLQARGIAPDVELVPVPVPQPGRVRLTEANPVQREADLDRAFAPREPARPSAVSMEYLAASPDGEEEVRIARDFLVATRAHARGDALERGRAFLDGRREVEEARVAAALSSAGLDWSPGPAGSAPDLRIRCAQSAEPKGDRVPFTCEVRNDGTKDAYRVLGRARAAFDLRNEEVVMGRVPAGTARTVALEGRLADDPSPRVTFTDFAFSVEDGPSVANVPLRIEAPRRPRPPSPGPPSGIEILVEPGPRETTDSLRNVRASIRGAGVRDAWVRVSNEDARLERKKVVYAARPATAPAATALDVNADVPLRPGLNEIGVCSRAGDEERCETAFVYRLPEGPKPL